MAVSNLSAASDTLTLTSHRIVNACSGEQRWLISASIGEVFDGDSLMSFDITIGFDTSKLRPTDGLFTGTLAEQMKFADISPAANFRVPGEMRVSGFTITRNVKGALPLFAVTGDFKQACNIIDSLTLPWQPEYNEEFKVATKVFVSSDVKRVTLPKADVTQGVFTGTELIEFTVGDSIKRVSTTLGLEKSGGKKVKAVYHLRDSTCARIVNFHSTVQVDSSLISPDSTQLELHFVASGRIDTVDIEMHAEVKEAVETDTLTGAVYVLDSCSCSTPTAASQTNIIVNNKPVSVKMDLNEDPLIRIRFLPESITIESVHGDPQQVRVFDMFGRIAAESVMNTQTSMELPTQTLSPGVYILQVHTVKGQKSWLFQR